MDYTFFQIPIYCSISKSYYPKLIPSSSLQILRFYDNIEFLLLQEDWNTWKHLQKLRIHIEVLKIIK